MIQTPQQLRSLLQRQRDAIQMLLPILTKEHAALSGKKMQDLEAIIIVKQQCMTQIETSSQEFLALLRSQSSPGKAGIPALLRQHDPQGTWGLETLWQQVDKLLAQCRLNNSINGKIIALSQRHVQRALAILRHGEAGANPCYTPTGTQLSPVASRTLGKV